MALYQDLFMRDNFGDSGVQPVADAYISASPDILPYGEGTLTQQQLINNYGPPLVNVPINAHRINNIYVRAKNNYNGATSGQIFLYAAPPNLLLQPSVWRNNLIPNANGNNYAVVSATTQGQIAPGDQPFYLTPSSPLGTHFCLLGRVSTQMNPNPLPTQNFGVWNDFVKWIRSNANVAWHNVDVVTTMPAEGYQNVLGFQNVNNSTAFYGFRTIYTNMPPGSQLRLYSLANPSASYTGFDTGLQTINNGSGSIGAGAVFPAQYQTSIFTTCIFPGAPPTPPPNVTIETESLGYQESLTDAEYAAYKTFMLTPEELGVDMEAFSLSGSGSFVQITSFNTLFNPQSGGSLLRKTRR